MKNSTMQSFKYLCELSLILIISNIVTGLPKTPLCYNEAKIFVRWDKPVSGWYYWNNHAQFWTRTPPSADYPEPTTIMYLLQYKEDHRIWELKMYLNGWTSKTMLTIYNQTENVYELSMPEVQTTNSRWKRGLTLNEEIGSPRVLSDVLPRPENPLKVLCPGPCQCETVRLHNIGEQTSPQLDTGPITFHKYSFSSRHFDNCRKAFERQNISALEDALEASSYSERKDIWTPSLFMSEECYLLYYHEAYDTWVAEMDFFNYLFGKLYSKDSGECIDTLPPPFYQRWEGNTLKDPNRFISYYKIYAECVCKCKQVLVETSLSKKPLSLRSSEKQDISKCSFNVHMGKQLYAERNVNEIPSKWFLESLFINESCDILFYIHSTRQWMLGVSIDGNLQFFHTKDEGRCLEHLSLHQNWVNVNGGEIPFEINTQCSLNL